VGKARNGLIQRSLVAYKFHVYQVLALPPKPVTPPTKKQLAGEKKKRALSQTPKYFGD